MAAVKSEIKKMLVRLRDKTGSFTDVDGQSISGEEVHEVEPSALILMAVSGGALIQLGNLEERAYYAEKEAKEAEASKNIEDSEGKDEVKERKGKKA